jgi:hypothetical protein
MPTITTKALQSLAKGKQSTGTLAEKLGSRGAGVLEFTRTPSGGVHAAFRYSSRGIRERAQLGPWDETSAERSLAALRRRAHELAQLHLDGKPVRVEAGGSLRQMLTDYTGQLGNPATAAAAAAAFKKNIGEKFMLMPANAVTGEQVRSWLAAMVRRGCTRQVNKVRSYLHAAFELQLAAGRDPRASAASTSAYGITANPVASGTVRVAEFDVAGDRVLTDEELRQLWKSLPDDDAGRAVQLSIRLGGQRAEQLVGAVLIDGPAVRMLDPKGARSQPRVHVVPVPAAALPILEGIKSGAAIFGGLAAEKVRAAAGGDYQHIRRTVETRLAELGIGSDVRARTQSHGLTGVQVRHYDRADYGPQIAAALARWNERLDAMMKDEKKSNVRPLRKARAA